MLKNKALIIFDLDGTLIDSVPSLAYSINLMLKELGKDELPQELIREFVGNGADMLVKRALVGKKEIIDGEIKEDYFQNAKELLLKYYAQNLNQKTILYPDVIDTLDKLKEQGYTLALATNKPIEFVPDILEYFNLDSYFKVTLGGGSTKHKKPNPEILLKICNDLNIPSSKSLMVGDSSSDILAAKAANMDSIALTYGYNQGINLEDLEPTVICNSFKTILDLLHNQ